MRQGYKTNSDQKFSTGQKDSALEFSPIISENTITSSLCKDMLLLLHAVEHIIVLFFGFFNM